MPRIHDSYVDVVVYVYRSKSDAVAGVRYGGSGFLVQVPLVDNQDWSELYVVTNRHVVRKAKTPVLRLNRRDGEVEYFVTTQDQWVFHADGDDIAILPLDTTHIEQLRIRPLELDSFLTHALVIKQDVGIGDDVFMIGRFINHEGKQRNAPAIRFGNIAMMPIEKIVLEDGLAQESFLVEIGSLPGYSGSPVFLYSLTASSDFSERDLRAEEEAFINEDADIMRAKSGPGTTVTGGDPQLFAKVRASFLHKGPYLLGIDSCHLHTIEPIRDKNGRVIPEGLTVRTNSGMAGVIPAWKIADLLNGEELTEMRRHEDAKITSRKNESSASLDSSETNEKQPHFTKADFESALKKASRRIDSSGPGAKKK